MSRRLNNSSNHAKAWQAMLEPRPIIDENGAGLCPVPTIGWPPAKLICTLKLNHLNLI